ncbi:MAG TPA: redoxin domain-containing protein [Nitrospiria bacterium]
MNKKFQKNLGLMVGVFPTILMIGLLSFPPLTSALVREKTPDFSSPFWINSEPKSLTKLRGKVVMVEFWTFGCYNCRNVEPQIKKWNQTYSDQGLVIIGVHTPEFAYEKNIESVREYVKKNNIRYSVAIDNTFSIWNHYNNRYWPTIYLIDKKGQIRYSRIGEGGYSKTEAMIQRLLSEP